MLLFTNLDSALSCFFRFMWDIKLLADLRGQELVLVGVSVVIFNLLNWALGQLLGPVVLYQFITAFTDVL